MVAAVSGGLEVAVSGRLKQFSNIVAAISDGLEVAIPGRPKQSGDTVIVVVLVG